MGKRSVKANKNEYQLAREAAGLTREAASEKMVYVSADRIEKVEAERSAPHPDEILAMAEAYRKPSLCNYYCSQECPIGQKYIPPVELKTLPQITLEILSLLNALEEDKNVFIEIAADSRITSEEMDRFSRIQQKLGQLKVAVDTLHLWAEQSEAEGKLGD